MEGVDANYVGPMESGRYEGEGVYTYPDGTRFEGSFHNGAFHGKGKMIFANGVFNGVFRDGKEVDGESAHRRPRTARGDRARRR